jgi:hypothetical protein
MRRYAASSSLFAGFALVLAIFGMSTAYAAVFFVNDTTDAVDLNPGDGACVTATGTCTLRAAFQETTALPGADIVMVPAGTYTLTIPGTGAETAAPGGLDVTDVLEIDGAALIAGLILPSLLWLRNQRTSKRGRPKPTRA